MVHPVKPETLPELIEENLKANCASARFLPPVLPKIEDTDTRIFKNFNKMVAKGQLQVGIADYTGETNEQLSKETLTKGVKYIYKKGTHSQEIMGEAPPEEEPLPEGEEPPRQMTRKEYDEIRSFQDKNKIKKIIKEWQEKLKSSEEGGSKPIPGSSTYMRNIRFNKFDEQITQKKADDINSVESNSTKNEISFINEV